MPGVRDIKRRIRSVKSTQQIIKAMKMVAAAKLRKTQEAVLASRPYSEKLGEVLGRIIGAAENPEHPLLAGRPVQKVGIVLITADNGLAGGYNANLIRKAMVELARLEEYEAGFITVGRKGRDFMRRRQKKIFGELTGIKDTPSYSDAREIVRMVEDLYLEGTFDQVRLIYQEFISPTHQRPVVKQLLPVPIEKGSGEEASTTEYIYEPRPKQVLEMLLPKYLCNVVYQALMEAKASEHGARMTAMGAAAENAGEMIDKLILSFNRARQGAITREIAEIVGGADAL